MRIKKLGISNFKSFKDVSVELEDFNILIGANASGKTNLVQIFKFLKDLTNFGIENAISMHGGIDYFLNTKLGTSRDFELEVTIDVHEEYPPSFMRLEDVGFEVEEIVYRLRLNIGVIRSRINIVEDDIRLKCKIKEYERKTPKYRKEEPAWNKITELGVGDIIFSKRGQIISLDVVMEKDLKDRVEKTFSIRATRDLFGSNRYRLGISDTLLQLPNLFYFGHPTKQIFQGISIYDFDPRLSKKAQVITGKAELEEDGSNLTIVLNGILKSGDRQAFYNILTESLPFIEKIYTKRFANNLTFQLREKYNRRTLLPSFLVSDGTINLTALITALFFQRKSLKIIEEPERNLHPYLISKVIDMMRDASQREQIVTTSHNPELVRYADPNEILLIKRGMDGFSEILKPAEKDTIKSFISSEMGLNDLFVQNLLEAYTK